jgi:hypothetical protein
VAVFIPDGDGELAAEAFPHAFVMVFPQMWDYLRVAMGDQTMSARDEFGALFDVIEELAIKDHAHLAVFVPHGLLAIGEADDAEAPRDHAEAGFLEEPFLVGATVENGVTHHAENAFRDGSMASEIDDSGNSAHVGGIVWGNARGCKGIIA